MFLFLIILYVAKQLNFQGNIENWWKVTQSDGQRKGEEGGSVSLHKKIKNKKRERDGGGGGMGGNGGGLAGLLLVHHLVCSK